MQCGLPVLRQEDLAPTLPLPRQLSWVLPSPGAAPSSMSFLTMLPSLGGRNPHLYVPRALRRYTGCCGNTGRGFWSSRLHAQLMQQRLLVLSLKTWRLRRLR